MSFRDNSGRTRAAQLFFKRQSESELWTQPDRCHS